MITEYSIFYSGSEKDALSIYFNDVIKTSTSRVGDFELIYCDNEIIGYKFYNITKLVKIHAYKMIHLPSNALIDLLNTLIPNEYEKLSYKEYSGFIISKVISMKLIPDKNVFNYRLQYENNSIIEIDLDGFQINVNDVVVIAKENTMLPNGVRCKSKHLCIGEDLGFKNDFNIYKLDNDSLIGADYFQMEENWYVWSRFKKAR